MSETEANDAVPNPGAETPAPGNDETLFLRLEAYEGPLDLLLQMARFQKVDLARISILALVEQYLAFINEARRLRLELAADYLVMAAWLAYLKSRLLLPPEKDEEEPSAEELAARLQLQLQRLEAIRDVAARLMARDRLGRDVFPRGAPEGLAVVKRAAFDCTLYELLKAYADIRAKGIRQTYQPKRRPVWPLEAAMSRLERMIGHTVQWTDIAQFLPEGGDLDFRRSALASTFLATLEMARLGKAEVQQLEPFGPLYVKKRDSA
ncbi:segregation and condensation protein A [Pedomonas sp. V897]|uniref:segregation and condensation protein A n=1 Tax=Pedomonas sp. V897 TaxID=3446482 RepID=UPI003EE19C73